ncbi:hypothetical protein MRX96_026104 [Rhipicephalus microplus]
MGKQSVHHEVRFSPTTRCLRSSLARFAPTTAPLRRRHQAKSLDPNLAASMSTDYEKAKPKPAFSHGTTSVFSNEKEKPTAPGSEAQSWHSMPHKTIEKLSGQDSRTKVTSSDDKAGHIEPSPGKASPQTKVSDPSAAAFKSTGSEKPKPQLASLHKEAAVPVSERRKPRREMTFYIKL